MSGARRKVLVDRGPVGKVAIAGVRQRGGKIKAVVVESATLVGKIESTVYADEATAYGPLKRHYHNKNDKHSIGEYVRSHVHTNGIKSVWGILKRSIHGTWHHVSPKHLGRYVDEAIRINEGNCELDTLSRMETFAGKIGNKRLRYRDLSKHKGPSSKVMPV